MPLIRVSGAQTGLGEYDEATTAESLLPAGCGSSAVLACTGQRHFNRFNTEPR